MTIIVKTFASIADSFGFRERSMEVPEGTSVSALVDGLAEENPAFRPYVSTLLTAVNEEYVRPSRQLRDRDVVALFPPVSGG